MAFLALRGFVGIQSETPFEECDHSQFGGAYVVTWPDLFCKQISLDLAMFDGDEGNLEGKNIMFQQILNSSPINWEVYIYKSYCVSQTFALNVQEEEKIF